MANPYIGEIRMAGFNFAPVGWAFCNGATQSISQNEALFALIGTTYGGDGQQTFNLPDLQGRIPVHFGSGFVQGQIAGTETVTVTSAQMPLHNHLAASQSTAGTQTGPGNGVWAAGTVNMYSANAPNATMNALAIGSQGGNQPHENMMTFLVVNFIIALQGIFPSQN